jgi:hypothetical protein
VNDDEWLARSVAKLMGIDVDQARAAVFEMKAARRRQRVLAAGLEKYLPQQHHPMRRVCDQDGGSGREVTSVIIALDQTIASSAGPRRAAAPGLLCQRCGHLLPADAFALNRSSRTGRSTWCKSCMRGYREGRRKEPRPRLTDVHRDRVLEMLAAGSSWVTVTEVTGLSAGSIGRIRNGKV